MYVSCYLVSVQNFYPTENIEKKIDRLSSFTLFIIFSGVWNKMRLSMNRVQFACSSFNLDYGLKHNVQCHSIVCPSNNTSVSVHCPQLSQAFQNHSHPSMFEFREDSSSHIFGSLPRKQKGFTKCFHLPHMKMTIVTLLLKAAEI